MDTDIVRVKPLKIHKLQLFFRDGLEGVVDLDEIIEFNGVFEQIRSWNEFKKVSVNEGFGSVEWPGECDLDPIVLYNRVKAAAKSSKSISV
ncbi:DUF2442 domain-containing protein [bacterium]|nr:DUF2442 domain-containing protein [bacterium]